MPLPLGGEHGLPYSRGLMARALMAVGVSPDRAYALARRVGDDLASRSSDVVEVDRLGDPDSGAERVDPCRGGLGDERRRLDGVAPA